MASPPLWTILNRLRQGSFRGVEFLIDSHQFSGGRRNIQHEFPQREQNRTEDLGRRIREFSIEFYILGDDYFAQRDAMLDALQLEGAGTLIHPYLGTKEVVPGEFRLTEKSSEGRIARFSATFSEAGEPVFPSQLADDLQTFLDKAEEMLTASSTAIQNALDVANQPAFVIQSAADSLERIADFLSTSVNKFTQPVSNLTFAISNLKADAAALVRLPGQLASRVQGVFSDLLDEFSDDPRTSEKILGNFSALDDEFDDVIGDTPSRNRERDNQEALINFGRETAFANQAKVAGNLTYASTEDAIGIRDGIIDDLDRQLFRIKDDDLFQTVNDLIGSLVSALPPSTLSELISFTPPKTLPALVISYRLFQDIDKEQEIIDQNNIRHPGFVPGGIELEVAGG